MVIFRFSVSSLHPQCFHVDDMFVLALEGCLLRIPSSSRRATGVQEPSSEIYWKRRFCGFECIETGRNYRNKLATKFAGRFDAD
jgi:hypothetical protein